MDFPVIIFPTGRNNGENDLFSLRRGRQTRRQCSICREIALKAFAKPIQPASNLRHPLGNSDWICSGSVFLPRSAVCKPCHSTKKPLRPTQSAAFSRLSRTKTGIYPAEYSSKYYCWTVISN